jgi:hypothetical protein
MPGAAGHRSELSRPAVAHACMYEIICIARRAGSSPCMDRIAAVSSMLHGEPTLPQCLTKVIRRSGSNLESVIRMRSLQFHEEDSPCCLTRTCAEVEAVRSQ